MQPSALYPFFCVSYYVHLQRGQYPWMATVATENELSFIDLEYLGLTQTVSVRTTFAPARDAYGGCSATLIASRWALTAAHCDEKKKKGPWLRVKSIVLGVHNISFLRQDNRQNWEEIPGTKRFVIFYLLPIGDLCANIIKK